MAIVNNGAMKIIKQKSLQNANFGYFLKYPEEGLLNYMIVPVLIF